MTDNSWWSDVNAAAFNNILSKQFTTYNALSYLTRNQPMKVIKPHQKSHSPRNRARRRMTTQFPTRTHSVIGSRSNDCEFYDTAPSTTQNQRPISWHPHYLQTYENCQYEPEDWVQYSRDIALNIDQQQHPTILTRPAVQEQRTFDYPSFPVQQMNMIATMPDNQANFHALDQFPIMGSTEQPQPPFQTCDDGLMQLPFGHPDAKYQQISINWTTPEGTQGLLPMPDIGEPFEIDSLRDTASPDELVGMGLYDSPAQVQSAGTLLSGSLPARRKGLKLEESFEPVPNEDEDENRVDNDDGDEDAESEPDPQTSTASSNVQPPDAQYSDVMQSHYPEQKVVAYNLHQPLSHQNPFQTDSWNFEMMHNYNMVPQVI